MSDLQFNNISLGGGTNPGQLKLYSEGILWKTNGGRKAIKVDKGDIVGVTWMKVPPQQLKLFSEGILRKKNGGRKAIKVDKGDIVRVTWMKVPMTNQIVIRVRDGSYYKLIGFRDQDITSSTNYFPTTFGIVAEEKKLFEKLFVSGCNWGEVDLRDNTLSFLADCKQGFEVSLNDLSQIKLKGKNDVTLEFLGDDTTREKDSLMEMTFHIPDSNTQFVGDENRNPAQVFHDKIVSMTDESDDVEYFVSFNNVAGLTPRGHFSVEFYPSFLWLEGTFSYYFQIEYSNVVHIFLLPQSNQPFTFVVVTLDPPIRTGQTLYPHIVLQFKTDHEVQSKLFMREELWKGKYKDKLEPIYKGPIHDVFTKILHGFSSAKITKPGTFHSCQDGYAVKSSMNAEDGVLYPLENSFFFLPNPPTLITHDMIDYVEFERHGAGGLNMHYFDLLIKLKSEQEHLFINIQRNEYDTLFDFISSKGIKIMNLGDAQVTDGVSPHLKEADDVVDPHLVRVQEEAGNEDTDEEDEDSVIEKYDAGSPTDDASESGGEKEKPAKKDPRKEPSASKVSSSKRKWIEVDEGLKKKHQKKKKDPNAPKRALSGFKFFSNMVREWRRKKHMKQMSI